MYRRSEKWLGNPFSAETLASTGIRSNSRTNALYRDWVTNRLGSNFRENGMLPKAQLKSKVLTSTAAMTGRWPVSRKRAMARIDVPMTSGMSGAEYCDVNEYWGS